MDEGMIFVLTILFLFVLPIVFVGIWTSHKKDMLKLNGQLSTSEKANYENEIASIKKRLEVLEAIVTDKRYQLDSEIADLQKSESIQ